MLKRLCDQLIMHSYTPSLYIVSQLTSVNSLNQHLKYIQRFPVTRLVETCIEWQNALTSLLVYFSLSKKATVAGTQIQKLITMQRSQLDIRTSCCILDIVLQFTDIPCPCDNHESIPQSSFSLQCSIDATSVSMIYVCILYGLLFL